MNRDNQFSGPREDVDLGKLWVDMGQQGDQATAHIFLNETINWKEDQREGAGGIYQAIG